MKNSNEDDDIISAHAHASNHNKELGFKEGLILAYNLLYNDDWNEDLQICAVELLKAIKEQHPEEWISSWKYEAFLGMASEVTLNYDLKFEAFKNAYDLSESPAPELLIELARCCYCPGVPPIPYEQAIKLLKESIEIHPYKQAAALLKSIYASMNDFEQEMFWAEQQLKIVDDKPPTLLPDFLSKGSGVRPDSLTVC